MNYLRIEYMNNDQHVEVRFDESLITVDEVLDAFIRFMLACGFIEDGVEDNIVERAQEIERRNAR